jgi:hypothetical protein
MSNTIFVLGAGASKAAGAPLMAEFLDVAHNLWKTGQAKEVEKNFADVFGAISALQEVHSKSQLDIDNVESVFATLEMAKTLNKFPQLDTSLLDSMIESMKIVIGQTIELTLKVPVRDKRPESPIPYGDFAELIQWLREESMPQHTIAIITFNYDLACDFALYQHGFYVDYALGEKTAQETLPLLKLHGSLNWAYCPELERVVPWTMQAHFSKYNWHFLSSDTQFVLLRMIPHLKDFKYEDKAVLPEPVLVPPTWNKSQHHRNLSDVWARSASELSEAENIFIIGYSLPETDAFFRYLYALGTVGVNPLKRVWVFNPDNSGMVEQRFRSLMGPAASARFRYFQNTFMEALQIIKKGFPGRSR